MEEEASRACEGRQAKTLYVSLPLMLQPLFYYNCISCLDHEACVWSKAKLWVSVSLEEISLLISLWRLCLLLPLPLDSTIEIRPCFSG